VFLAVFLRGGKMIEWVSVKERLPKDESAVLVTDGTAVDVTFCQLTYCGDDPNEKSWFIRVSMQGFVEVTHWMPLPALPNK